MAPKPYDECYFVNYQSYEDLRLYEVGSYECPPSYHFGPILRDHYILHFIRKGRGFLRMGERDFPVEPNQAFITPPRELIYYEADKEDPWSYIWIIFNGKKAIELLHEMGFTRQTPIFSPAVPCPEISQCMESLLVNHNREHWCIGMVYQLFSYMIETSGCQGRENTDHKDYPYIQKAIGFITEKYSEAIRIQEIAEYCGLNRSYLTRIFKAATGETPQEYLIRHRINKARQLLKTTPFPIQHIAYSVGYTDPFAFSKLFKQKTGVSPSTYREQHQKTELADWNS